MSNPEIKNRFTGKVIVKAGKYTSIQEAVRANKADLREANLREADLREADLREADLREANLWRADLRGADLREANLREADLRRADLRGADLWEADLREADLREADLREANLWEANLWRADLRGADLREANLDFSCFPLWCGSFNMTVDDRLIWQLICHVTRLNVSECGKEAKKAVQSLNLWRNKFCKYRDDVDKIKPLKLIEK